MILRAEPSHSIPNELQLCHFPGCSIPTQYGWLNAQLFESEIRCRTIKKLPKLKIDLDLDVITRIGIDSTYHHS